MNRFIIYAPGVHTGGGLVLLKSLLLSSVRPTLESILDIRCQNQIQMPVGAKVNWCAPSFFGRISMEIRLRYLVSPEDVVLCFHGLPPLLPNSARVVVFIQNRLNLAADSTKTNKSTLRSTLKRLLFRTFSINADEFIVQTPSMRLAVQKCLGILAPVKVLPFLDAVVFDARVVEIPKKNFDFIYVADGVTHKNHRMLLAAWVILSEEDIRPSLVLTLGTRDQKLVDEIEKTAKAYGLQIHNAGTIDRECVLSLYSNTRALIFPSKVESFGIPLIEAAQFGLPIIASELDYVRDVCIPAETFDPDSPVSIARAIKRFLQIPCQPERLRSSDEFIEELLD